MITNVYVDGFNLSYGCLKGQPHKWLDLEAMCALLLPKNEIKRIRYFTARVKERPGDLQVPVRQHAYLRALYTLPNVEAHFGNFMVTETRMPLAQSPITGAKTAKVIKTEENGSDVSNVPTCRRVPTRDFGAFKPPEHKLLAVPIAETVVETHVGGHIIDRGTDGSECRWARVPAYESPDRFVFSWDISSPADVLPT